MKRLKLMLPLLYCAAVGVVFLAQPAFAADDAKAADTQVAPSGYTPVADENYRIKPDDILRLDVWGDEELRNIQLFVTPDGKVNIPYIGTVQAAGLTQAELTEQIIRKFESEEIFINPRVQIAVMTMHRARVRVLGEVWRPGEVEFKEGDRLLDAIAQAGSYKDNAWLEKATLTRKDSNEPIEINLKKLFAGDLTQNYELKEGDVIYIPQENYENKIYVLGYVAKPGIYSLKDRTTVMAAISLAGGPTERGSLRGTVVVRGDPERPVRVPCNLTKLIDKGDLTQDIVLQAGDVVMVPETNKPNWAQISGVLGTLMNLTYLRRYGLF